MRGKNGASNWSRHCGVWSFYCLEISMYFYFYFFRWGVGEVWGRLRGGGGNGRFENQHNKVEKHTNTEITTRTKATSFSKHRVRRSHRCSQTIGRLQHREDLEGFEFRQVSLAFIFLYQIYYDSGPAKSLRSLSWK